MDETADKPNSLNPFKRFINETSRLTNIEGVVNILSDIRDNQKYKSPAEKIENPKFNQNLAQRLFPEKEREKFFQLSKRLKVGERTGFVGIVGERASNTTHPHMYEISKTVHGIELTFADPEDTLKDRSPAHLRPNVVNLLQARLDPFDGSLEEFAYLRFKSDRYSHEQMNLLNQFQVAKSLIDENAVPDFLEGNPGDVLYRMVLKDNLTVLQSRHVAGFQIRDFLDGKKLWLELEGKLHSMQAVLQRFGGAFSASPEEISKYQRTVDRIPDKV